MKKIVHAYAAHTPMSPLEKFTYHREPLQAYQVAIDIMYCGICHSDLSMIDDAWGMTTFPLVPGHEIIGTVSEVGEKVTRVSVGEVVGLGWHCGYCNQCYDCKKGHPNLCVNPSGTIVGHHGGFAQSVTADENSVVGIPSTIDLEAAGPLLCGGITVFNPLVEFNVKPTDRVAVVGIGGLGHIAIEFLQAWGCDITAFTHRPDKKNDLLRMGAHRILDSTNQKDLEGAAHQFDFILSTVNKKLDWDRYLNTLKPRGRLHLVGAVLEPLEISALSLIMGQRQVSGSPVGSPENIKKMLAFAAQHQIKPQVEVYPMSEVNTALDRLRSGRARYRIVLKNLI